MAAPTIKNLIFPPVLTLFPTNGAFQSETTTSGANVLSKRTGDVVMRFEVGIDWSFENGTQQQETMVAVVAGEPADITMPYRLKTALSDAVVVRISVVVRMDDEDTDQTSLQDQAVGYATMLKKFFHMFKFGKGAT